MSEAAVIRPAMSVPLTGYSAPLRSLTFMRESVTLDALELRRGLEKMLNNGRGRILIASSSSMTEAGACSGLLMAPMAQDSPALPKGNMLSPVGRRDSDIGSQLQDRGTGRGLRSETARIRFRKASPLPSFAHCPVVNRPEFRLSCSGTNS